jgi:hypothetical protein
MRRFSIYFGINPSKYILNYTINYIYSTCADFVFIPESPPSSDNWKEKMCQVIRNVNIFCKNGFKLLLLIQN